MLTLGRVYNRGFRIRLQLCDDAVLYTTLDSGWSYILQCIRWARAHWQGNATVVFTTSYWWKRHPWGCYVTYFGSLMTPALVVDFLLYRTLKEMFLELEVEYAISLWLQVAFWIWVFTAKTLKMLPHLSRHPADMIFVPALIAFTYVHGLINVYALVTMLSSHWSSRRPRSARKAEIEIV